MNHGENRRFRSDQLVEVVEERLLLLLEERRQVVVEERQQVVVEEHRPQWPESESQGHSLA